MGLDQVEEVFDLRGRGRRSVVQDPSETLG